MNNSFKRRYYKKNTIGNIICIVHGEQGYYDTDMKSELDIRNCNKVFDNTDNEINAAETCSMFDIWDKFDEIVKKLDMVDEVMH